MDKDKVTYLGDGLYAYFDGHENEIELRANDAWEPTDTVYIDWYTYCALLDFAKQCWPEKEEREA